MIYFERGAHVVVEIYDNRVEISNPGGLTKGLRPENFGKHSFTRNPLIAGLLHRCNYIEKAGTGIQRMRDGMRGVGLPEPTFEFTSFFTVIFLRYDLLKDMMAEFDLNDKRGQRIVTILRHLAIHEFIDVAEIAHELSATDRTIRNDLEFLIQKGWVISAGSTRWRDYELTEPAKLKMSKYV